MAYNKIPLPVKLHPALDQSVIVSTIALHSTKRRQPVSNSCDGYIMNSSIPKALGRGGSREYKAIAYIVVQSVPVAELPDYLSRRHVWWSCYVTAEFLCNIFTQAMPGLAWVCKCL